VDTFVSQVARDRGVDSSVVEAEFFQNVRPSSLIKRFASSQEVANMVVYLSSELAAATNGSALRVDGGTVRSIV
jgi:enoyl-[acyl-carrier-protein] reductase (NADH)